MTIRRILLCTVTLLMSDTAGATQSVDLQGRLKLRNANLCELNPIEQSAFDDLLRPTPRFSHVPVRFTVTRRTLADGATEQVKRSEFIGPVRWSGLPLVAVQARAVQNPESEGMIEQSLVFALTPMRLRVALARLGGKVPLAPAYRRVSIGEEERVLNIAKQAGGAALTCAWDA